MNGFPLQKMDKAMILHLFVHAERHRSRYDIVIPFFIAESIISQMYSIKKELNIKVNHE